MVEVDHGKIDTAFDELDKALITTLTAQAVVAHVAGDLAVQKQLGIKTTSSLVKSAASNYGKEYKKLLVDRGGGMVVDKNGKLVFKDWFSQSSRESREKVADIINTGIKEGKGIRETEKDLKEFFNQKKRHAELVARTETAKSQSIATTNRLIEQGIEHVQWITAEDERVRHSHAERHNKIYPTGSIFVLQVRTAWIRGRSLILFF
jgi:SPP1 gp7 family putative phage head morphogenesis protein